MASQGESSNVGAPAGAAPPARSAGGEGEDLEALISSIDREIGQGPASGRVVSRARARRAVGQTKYVVFTLGATDYAVTMANVLEIQRPPAITPIPNVPGWVSGVTNLRGGIVSVVELRQFLGMDASPGEQDGRIMVVRSLREEMTTALVVDRVVGIRNVAADHILEPTPNVDERVAPFVSGLSEMDDHVVMLLDIERLLLSPEMRQFEPN